MRLRTLLAALALVVAPATAEAARPSGSAPTRQQPVHTFTGEAAGFGPNLHEQTMRASCRQPFCDGYVISVPRDLPEGSAILLKVTAQQATGFTDLFVMHPDGTKTHHPGREGDPATEVRLEQPVHGDWLVQIYTNAFFATSTGAYTGRVELILPPEPEPGP